MEQLLGNMEDCGRVARARRGCEGMWKVVVGTHIGLLLVLYLVLPGHTGQNSTVIWRLVPQNPHMGAGLPIETPGQFYLLLLPSTTGSFWKNHYPGLNHPSFEENVSILSSMILTATRLRLI